LPAASQLGPAHRRPYASAIGQQGSRFIYLGHQGVDRGHDGVDAYVSQSTRRASPLSNLRISPAADRRTMAAPRGDTRACLGGQLRCRIRRPTARASRVLSCAPRRS
jgi:hypothetical protein